MDNHVAVEIYSNMYSLISIYIYTQSNLSLKSELVHLEVVHTVLWKKSETHSSITWQAELMYQTYYSEKLLLHFVC